MTDASIPKNHPGERLASYFDSFFKTIVGISTFGASLTFSKVISPPVDPWIDYGFSKDQVQLFLALSWLFFILDLGFTSLVASALSLYRPQAIQYFGITDSSDRRIVMWYATIVSFVLFTLAIVAFLFLGLAVTAYVGPTGWTAVAFTSIFAVTVVGVIVWQSPIGSKSIGQVTTSHESQSQGYPSDEKLGGYQGGRYTGDDDFRNGYNDGTAELGRYADADPGTGNGPSWVLDPVVPPYTADLRRLRSQRGSSGSRYDRGRGYQQQRGDWIEPSDMRAYGNRQIS